MVDIYKEFFRNSAVGTESVPIKLFMGILKKH